MALVSVFDAAHALPPGTGAFMSTRQGGLSRPPWDSLNLGDHVGDVPEHVRANRETLARGIGVRPVFLSQVHGTAVLELHQDTLDGVVADACFTAQAGLACTVMVADCLPVLLWDAAGEWVAAAHAGWRGLAGQAGQGVLECLWHALSARGAQAGQTCAWLGPCIGPRAFEVGPDVKNAFALQGGQQEMAFRPGRPGHWWADLATLARMRLQDLGLRTIMGNPGSDDWCTVSRPALFFSYRRDALRLGGSGRMAASIWRLRV